MSNGMNSQLGERWAVIASKAGTATSTPLVTNYVDTASANWRRFIGIAVLGIITDAETLDFSFVKASDSSGTGKATLKAATQRAAHATANDNKVIIISLDMKDILADETKTFIGLNCVTSSTGGGIVGLTLLASDGRHGPVSEFDYVNVVEIVQ